MTGDGMRTALVLVAVALAGTLADAAQEQAPRILRSFACSSRLPITVTPRS